MVTAVKGLPTQQQLLLCAATSLLGADGPPPGISTPSASFGQRRSSLGFNSPLSVRKQVTNIPSLLCLCSSLHCMLHGQTGSAYHACIAGVVMEKQQPANHPDVPLCPCLIEHIVVNHILPICTASAGL